MNVFIRELRATRKSLIIWSVCIFLMAAGGMGKFAGYQGSGGAMNDMISKLPKTLRIILGFGSLDLTKVTGFFGMLFMYILIMAAIHAAMLGANIISKEEQDKTTEFLFVKPVSRAMILTRKLTAALFNIVVFNLVTYLSSLMMVEYYSKGEPVVGVVTKLMVGLFFVQLIFMTLGTGIAAISKRPGISASVSTGVMLVTFILSIAISLNDKLDWLKYLTPFKYFDAERVISKTGLEPVYIIISILVISAFVFATYRFYTRRDLKI